MNQSSLCLYEKHGCAQSVVSLCFTPVSIPWAGFRRARKQKLLEIIFKYGVFENAVADTEAIGVHYPERSLQQTRKINFVNCVYF